MSMDVSIVIPTYNERENVESIIGLIQDVFTKNNILGEILIIDDNSPDGTGKIADKLSKKYTNIRVFHRKGKLGIGAAYKFGFKKSIAPVVMEMDADNSHNPKYIPDFLDAMKTHDFAVGNRYIKGGGIINWSTYRKFVSSFANSISATILRVKTKDITTGYRVYKKEVLQRINIDKITSNGYSFQVEILTRLIRAGCTLKEVPIVFVDRTRGKSKLSKLEVIKFLYTVLRLRLTR